MLEIGLKSLSYFGFQVEHKYQESTCSECPKLAKLHASYNWLKDGSSKPPSSASSVSSASGANPAVTKYTDADYI